MWKRESLSNCLCLAQSSFLPPITHFVWLLKSRSTISVGRIHLRPFSRNSIWFIRISVQAWLQLLVYSRLGFCSRWERNSGQRTSSFASLLLICFRSVFSLCVSTSRSWYLTHILTLAYRADELCVCVCKDTSPSLLITELWWYRRWAHSLDPYRVKTRLEKLAQNTKIWQFGSKLVGLRIKGVCRVRICMCRVRACFFLFEICGEKREMAGYVWRTRMGSKSKMDKTSNYEGNRKASFFSLLGFEPRTYSSLTCPSYHLSYTDVAPS